MKKGFTLIEFLLVISILGILAGLSIPFLINFKISQDLDNTVQEMISILKKAQEKSISGEKDSSWGVNFSQPFRYILFRENFIPNNPENEIYEYSKNINLTSSGKEIKFLKLSGEIEKEFVIDLTTVNKKIKIIINQQGTINYQ